MTLSALIAPDYLDTPILKDKQVRYFLHLAYRGAGFHGWQIQPQSSTVQGVIEQALGTLLRMPVSVTGAGRTDAGVNARMMIAHLDLPEDIDPGNLVRKANAIIGPDIALYSLRPMHADAHARFDASSRTYRYFAHTLKDPFTGKLSWGTRPDLDFEAMNRAAKLLTGQKDFTSFAKLHSDAKTNICTVTSAQWVEFEPNKYYFEISADRFLRNMVRAVVGTLVEVGRHRIEPEEILTILKRKDRCAAGTSMPAEALFLWEVKYPYYEP